MTLFANFFTIYILPAIVLLLLGALLAFTLAFMSNKFAVPRDKKIDDVLKNLAGANCGGCGFAGCDAFAQALVAGKAKISDCTPTSKDSKAKIAEILGVEAGSGVEQVAVVHCNGGVKAKDKFSYQGYGDCISAQSIAGGGKVCDQACLGFGSCVKACGFDAIRVNKDKGIAEVNEKCVACGMCITTCPKSIIGKIPKDAKVYVACSNKCKGKEVMDACEVGCIACTRCVKACPSSAIEMVDNVAVIDYTKCTNCGECAKVCPRKTIVVRN